MVWVNLAFGFQCSPHALAHECSWWLAQWLANGDQLTVLIVQ